MDNKNSPTEREQFEAVWKRVTAVTDTSLTDSYLMTSPSDEDTKKHEPNPPTADDAELLRQLIAEETGIACCYLALAKRLSGQYTQYLLRFYYTSKENLKKLQTNYFLLTGERFNAKALKLRKSTPLSIMHDLYWREISSAKAYETAADATRSNKLSGILSTISAIKKSQADEMEALIGRIIK